MSHVLVPGGDALNTPGDGKQARAAAVTRVIRNVVGEFEIQGRDLATILGVSPAWVSRLIQGGSSLAPGSHAFDNAVLLLRVLNALGAMMGSPDVVHRFLYEDHRRLDGVPVKLMSNPEGLVDVTRYVESLGV